MTSHKERGIHDGGTPAPASGKNTLKGGKQPSPGFNQGGVLTKGVIETKTAPVKANPGVGHEGGLANTPYRGPGYDPEAPAFGVIPGLSRQHGQTT